MSGECQRCSEHTLDCRCLKNVAIDWTLPIVTVSESNISEFWGKRSERRRKQKLIIWHKWKETSYGITASPVEMPCVIRLTRISPRSLDDDNLRGALKACRDGIADCINPGRAPGRADNLPGMTFEYAQEKGKPKEKSVRIQIFYWNIFPPHDTTTILLEGTMSKILLISLGCFMMSCTLSFQNVMTNGKASDVVDSDPKTDSQIDANVSIPVNPM